ncbi:helicase-related protein [Sphingopyxis indica]|uniref:ATP-dependent RNA helicase SUPV3L1/SUV3 n=1 Tax=Sphingopyxis indica TaxID=436663 RepID=A0A239GL22_9SPHN|nr:helicase-related protein [Sphingopyxis indica]SNS69173.1 ATP-dependent RNA helicase SUPV3L1/SUV3 [Sphingopyxis indica]
MPSPATSPVKAVLGPTNTGKTHLAVERLTAHASGMMGFPLRLLAREVYDRVVRIKGPGEVALVTGEERIMPPGARYLLGTMEALPVERDVAFVGIDEAQLGADPERGHVFTDRMLRARGREETMILGSASITGLVRDLVPEAEIVTRPRFSTLSYAGPMKLSRLPKRSAIVAFSAEEVYAIAEMLRRFAGGAAVVMGALSPRTRNSQVAMFEAGEVDYLVATDAIGMGLNLDVTHVAFASLQKFDGRRLRRLTIAEMAQIAGRAGRHQQDGSFGTIGQPQGGMTPEEIMAIEEHRFPPLASLFWRNPLPRFTSLDRLIGDLGQMPAHPSLRAAPEAVDLAVLRHLAGDIEVAARGRDSEAVERLWDVCGLPDFEQLGAEHHSRTVLKLWQWRTSGSGTIDAEWFARRLARLDDTDGDIDQLASRIAAVRTLCFIAQRGDWIADAAGWTEQTQALESRLSDALHAALAQRFVDRRLALLIRDAGQRNAALPVAVGHDGTVAVDGEAIGTLTGFQFKVDATARASDHRLLLAAAEKHLRGELARRATALAEGDGSALALVAEAGAPPRLAWNGTVVAALAKGTTLIQPSIQLEPALRRLDPPQVQAIAERLQRFVAEQLARHARPLATMGEAAGDLFTPPRVRALLAAMTDGGGLIERAAVDDQLAAMSAEERPQLRKLGLTIGTLDIFHPQLLKPEAVRWRAALLAAQQGGSIPPLPPHGAVLQKDGDATGLAVAGFRRCASGWLRIDMAEKLARQAHAARMQAAAPPTAPVASGDPHDAHHDEAGGDPHAPEPPGFAIDPALATSLGLDETARRALLASFGFRAVGDPALERWRWSGRKRAETRKRAKRGRKDARERGPHPNDAPSPRAKPAKAARPKKAKGGGKPVHDGPRPPRGDRAPRRGPSPHSPFAGLAALLAEARED